MLTKKRKQNFTDIFNAGNILGLDLEWIYFTAKLIYKQYNH